MNHLIMVNVNATMLRTWMIILVNVSVMKENGSKTNGAVNSVWKVNVLILMVFGTQEITNVYNLKRVMIVQLKAAKCASTEVGDKMKEMINPCGNGIGACNVLQVTGNTGKMMAVNVLMHYLNLKDGLNGAMMRAGDAISAEKITSGENMIGILVVGVLPDGGNQ